MSHRRHPRPTLDRRIAQRNDLARFMQHHAADYSVQVNFGVFGQPDHVCISLPHRLAEAIYDETLRALIQSIEEAEQ